jgi:hypothetical protein
MLIYIVAFSELNELLPGANVIISDFRQFSAKNGYFRENKKNSAEIVSKSPIFPPIVLAKNIKYIVP